VKDSLPLIFHQKNLLDPQIHPYSLAKCEFQFAKIFAFKAHEHTHQKCGINFVHARGKI
jgi:hypothetical protein